MASIEESTCKNGFSEEIFFRFVVGLVFKTCGNMDLDVSDITFSDLSIVFIAEVSPVAEDSPAPLVVEDDLAFQLWTLPVKRSVVGDGDGFTVWVQVKDYSQVPMDILFSIQKHHNHLKQKK
ncbi:hypothetical protein L1987_52012 [Smallanthus sonchifolius]|uniref:Uncharacterized protein n=1 Tax=Smallanthus sonchifolius TaxID=185202 RepID=A0ACB9ET37_9ASTR|nr:hypothetical protein L1987_52012 [Smallanthus sonchifolius]